MKKKVLPLFLALALSLGLATPLMAAENAFADVEPGAYYAQAVAWAVENQITSGTSDTTFSPDDTCTRGQIITFLWRWAGSPEAEAAESGTVRDIAESDYFYPAVLWAKKLNLFEGDSFQPNLPCTRLMAVEFIWRRFGCPAVEGNRFSDVSSGAVNWAVARGITSGTSDTAFSPDDTCTRGQIVTLLHRDATFKPIIGTYRHEKDSGNRLDIISNGSRPQFAFYTIDGQLEVEVVRGTLISNNRVMKWDEIEIELYRDFVIVTFTGDLAAEYPGMSGKYTRQTN